MISGSETNVVYFSDLFLKDCEFSIVFRRLVEILNKHKVEHLLLTGTKDIWCRDYMPVQKSHSEFIQFRYEPSYLKSNQEYQTLPNEVNKANGFSAKYSHINLDGGNVISSTDKVILTTRIFKENPEMQKSKLINELHDLFECDIHFVPNINTDFTGHVDGHMRFIDNHKILVNCLEGEYKYWRKGFEKMIYESGIEFIEMPWFETDCSYPKHSSVGVYVNYLEVGNLIIFPIFDVRGNKDDEALEIIRNALPDRKIEPIQVNELANAGGLLNCVSWTIKESSFRL